MWYAIVMVQDIKLTRFKPHLMHMEHKNLSRTNELSQKPQSTFVCKWQFKYGTMDKFGFRCPHSPFGQFLLYPWKRGFGYDYGACFLSFVSLNIRLPASLMQIKNFSKSSCMSYGSVHSARAVSYECGFISLKKTRYL